MTRERPLSRVSRSRQAAQASYDRLSRWYDWLSGPYERRWMQAALSSLAVRPGEAVLEIGPGTGHALLTLSQAAGPAGQAYGVDLSTGMLEVAGRRLQAGGAAQAATLLCGDAAQLPFAPGTFDVLFMSFTLELFDTPEIPQVLGECWRVLRPGGRMGVVGMSRGASGLAVRLYERLHQALPQIIDCRPIDVSAALAAAGFEIRQAQVFSMFGLPGERVVGYRS